MLLRPWRNTCRDSLRSCLPVSKTCFGFGTVYVTYCRSGCRWRLALPTRTQVLVETYYKEGEPRFLVRVSCGFFVRDAQHFVSFLLPGCCGSPPVVNGKDAMLINLCLEITNAGIIGVTT